MAYNMPMPQMPQFENDLPRTIESVFNMYNQQKQLQMQQQLQQQQLEMGRANMQRQKVADVIQYGGLDPASIQPWQMEAARSSMGPQGPTQYGQPLPENPQVAILKGLIESHKAGLASAAEKQRAETSKVSAEAKLVEAEASMLGGGGSSLASGLVDLLESGKADMGSLNELIGRNQNLRLGVASEVQKRGINIEAGALKHRTEEAEAGVRGTKGQEVGAIAGSLKSALDYVEPLIGQLSPSQMASVNEAYQKGLKSINDPVANKALIALNRARRLSAQILPGSEEDIGAGLTKEGFAGMKEAIMFGVNDYVSRVRGKGIEEPGAAIPTKKTANLSTEQLLRLAKERGLLGR